MSITASEPFLITAAPGYTGLPVCAQFGLSFAVAQEEYDECATTGVAMTSLISCLCNTAFNRIEGHITSLVQQYSACSQPQVESAESVLTEYCSANAAGELVTASTAPTFSPTVSSSTATPRTTSAGPSATSSPPSSSADRLSGAAIGGIVTAAVVVVVLIAVISYLVIRSRQRQQQARLERQERELQENLRLSRLRRFEPVPHPARTEYTDAAHGEAYPSLDGRSRG